MFLIIENERGLAGTMMHEAAGGLEQLNPPESALSMLEKKKNFIFWAKSPVTFLK